MKRIYFIFIVFSLFACQQEEEVIPQSGPEQGGVVTETPALKGHVRVKL